MLLFSGVIVKNDAIECVPGTSRTKLAPLWPRKPLFFSLDEKNQKSSQPKGFFAARLFVFNGVHEIATLSIGYFWIKPYGVALLSSLKNKQQRKT
jgi:hypothetical protein